jgi:hypothetical protein
MHSINRKKNKLTHIIITPAAMHEADTLIAPKTPQIMATRKNS